VQALLGFEPAEEPWVRIRHACPGHAHGVHSDAYARGGLELQATALLYLSSCEGGETEFPRAQEPPVLAPCPGRGVLWFTRRDGRVDESADHGIAAVRGGERVTVTWFFHATDAAVRAASRQARDAGADALVVGWASREEPADDAGGIALTCVVDGTPPRTRDLLQKACLARGVRYEEVHPNRLDPLAQPLPPGGMLYCPAGSLAAARVERQLWAPWVATLYDGPHGPFDIVADQAVAMARAGLPTPRSAWVRTRDRATLDRVVEGLGGLPVVVRRDSGEGGVGVLLAESRGGLYALVDLLLDQGESPRLVAFVPDAMHWRVIVVDGRVVTAYRNPVARGDFRSEPSSDPADYGLDPPVEVARLALEAAAVAQVAMAGVDILSHPSGRLYVLEANFPCFFPAAYVAPGVDVAGRMVDTLLARRAALIPEPRALEPAA
jgi:hypothetical protein